MVYRILAIDHRYHQPTRVALMNKYLRDDCELIVPENFDSDTILNEAKSASAIITASAPLGEELMAAGPDICVVGSTRTGVDSIDIVAATRLGIPVIYTPGSIRASAVAEHAFTLLLMLARRTWLWGKVQKFQLFSQLEGKTIGIIGLGNIGRAVARRAAAFDMKICAFTRTKGKFEPKGFKIEETGSLEELLAVADFVVLTLPLTSDTRNIISDEELGRMKKNACLVNIARGPHVNTNALVTALKNGRISGAALDVTEPEPLPDDHPLWNMDNVLISPHVASFTEELQDKSYELLCDNIHMAISGKNPRSLLNPEIFDRRNED